MSCRAVCACGAVGALQRGVVGPEEGSCVCADCPTMLGLVDRVQVLQLRVGMCKAG
jgi:hypothetical protein